MNAFQLVWILCGLVQDAGSLPPQSKWQTQRAAQVPIELIETDSRKVAYIEHRGPYWSLGPIIDTVAHDAKAMGHRDSLVIRYLDDPVAAPPGGLRAEVGFEFAGSDVPKSPYKIAEWPPALVARKSVGGPDGLSTRHFTSLKAWAQTQGLVPAGDLIALVELAEGGESTAIERAEILLPVCVPDPPGANAPPTSPGTHATETAPTESSEAAEPPRGPRVVTKVIQLPVPSSQDRPAEEPSRIALGTPVQAVTPSPPAKPSVPIRQWIEESRFVEVAIALIPERVDSASQLWADQMAARIIALANGVQQLDPGEEGWLSELANQLAERRKANRTGSPKSTPRVIGPSMSASPKDADRKALMQELDRLMGNVSYRTLTSEQVRDELTKLLERAPTLAAP